MAGEHADGEVGRLRGRVRVLVRVGDVRHLLHAAVAHVDLTRGHLGGGGGRSQVL